MDLETLQQSIQQYENQLANVMKSLDSENVSGRSDLIDLKTDLEQLINVSKDYLAELTDQNTDPKENEIDQEYSNFMSEIAALDEVVDNESTQRENEHLNDDLSGIVGMKCLVSHVHKSGCEEKHLAMVSEICHHSDIRNMEDIQVKVMFTHPTLKEMLPCPYFLNGDCKYDSEKCQYSHGKIVPLINIRDYDKPDYSAIQNGDCVLVKQKDQLWSKATVTDIENDTFTITIDGKTHSIVNFEDVVPIEQITLQDDSTTSDSSDSENDYIKESTMQPIRNFTYNDSDLAEWEQYTKGIGSKLMLAMGYQMGMGLGKQGEGRVEPVPVQILPPRMSLDHCMKMRDEAGDENLFSINRHIRKMKKKLINQDIQNTSTKKSSDVFGFINDMFSNKKTSTASQKQTLKSSTSKELNLSSFHLGENIKKTEKDILKYQQSLKRQKLNTAAHKEISQKLEAKQAELCKLKKSEKAVFTEQRFRKEKTKLDIF